jgi:OOP family OmpA-OmpF porin
MKNILLVLLLSTRFLFAQNLVPNPSFEDYDSCPQGTSDFSVKDWVNPTTATPDYYNVCSSFEVGIPSNFFGYQSAKSGSAYIGIHTSNLGNFDSDYREYVQCKLIKPLEVYKTYRISFYVSLSDSSLKACDNIGAYLSKTPVSLADNLNLNFNPQIVSERNVPFSNKEEWIEISGVFIATGGEQYITIGIFSNNINTSSLDLTSGWFEPYYYIDDVSVILKESSPIAIPSAFSPNNDGNNDRFFPIYFDSLIRIRQFRIYNQWGELVHNDPTSGWDGSYQSQPQSFGVYTYFVFADIPLPDNLGKSIEYKKIGAFTLFR